MPLSSAIRKLLCDRRRYGSGQRPRRSRLETAYSLLYSYKSHKWHSRNQSVVGESECCDPEADTQLLNVRCNEPANDFIS